METTTEIKTLADVYKMGFIDGAKAMFMFLMGKLNTQRDDGSKQLIKHDGHLDAWLLKKLRREARKLLKIEFNHRGQYAIVTTSDFGARTVFVKGSPYEMSKPIMRYTYFTDEGEAIKYLIEYRRAAIENFVLMLRNFMKRERINKRLKNI